MATDKPTALPPVRRVIIGQDAQGRSFIEEDGAPSEIRVEQRPGYRMANVWRTTATPAPVHAPGDIELHRGVLPPQHGTIFRVTDVPPEPVDPEERRAAMEATIRSVYPDADLPKGGSAHVGMHKTPSIDYVIILEGQMTAIFDTGETILNAGDILVQRGTNHAVANRSGKICRIASVMIGGTYG